jgi:hypothetical protein
MTSEGLVEMFEGDSADTCAGNLPLVSMGGRAEGLVCTDPRARTPIGASGNYIQVRWLISFSVCGLAQENCQLAIWTVYYYFVTNLGFWSQTKKKLAIF